MMTYFGNNLHFHDEEKCEAFFFLNLFSISISSFENSCIQVF
jgi:hypothetical protein